MNKLAHILLVEDNRMDIELTLDAFHEAKLLNTIHIASDGQEALDYLFGRGKFADRKAYPKPNLVLLDLKLPGIDGFEVLRQIKSTPILKRLPGGHPDLVEGRRRPGPVVRPRCQQLPGQAGLLRWLFGHREGDRRLLAFAQYCAPGG